MDYIVHSQMNAVSEMAGIKVIGQQCEYQYGFQGKKARSARIHVCLELAIIQKR